MTEKKFRWWLLAIPAGLVAAILMAVVALPLRSGIQVTVENSGTKPLKSVTLHVTGASYNLGDITPGASATARVKPTGESHLEIEFTDAGGEVRRLDAGGYFESGYRGTIRVSIKGGVIDTNEQDIQGW